MTYVSFAGNIASGKSTLAARLATKTLSALVTELVEENPFLAPFYDDPRSWAFRLQMFNLTSRARLIVDGAATGSFVLDRSFEEDIVYAQVAIDYHLVSAQEFQVYEELYDLLLMALPRPSMLVYLRTSSIDELAARITRRGRSMELEISNEYLARLQRGYDDWFDSYAGAKRVLMSDSNDVEDELDVLAATL